MIRFIKSITGLFLVCSGLATAAESYLVMEANSGRVLLAHESEKKRPIASLTKVATAKVALDWAKASGSSLSSYASVPAEALLFGGPNPMNLRAGSRIQLRDALYSALLGSDNIAAYTLADHVGREILLRRQISGDAQATFVHEMNQLAKALGMRKTRFYSSHGLDPYRKKNYASSSDLARLCVHVMRDVGFTFYVKQKNRSLSVIDPNGEKQTYIVSNTNPLLGQQGVNGIKTGFTTAAGQCIAINANRSPIIKKIDETKTQIRKRDLIVIILGSNDRISRARELINTAWPIYDGWAAAGFPLSPKGNELIVVPQLH